MNLPIYQVDAFANEVFRGNPAAVCPLSEWLPESLLQSIAAENNLSETAFFVRRPDGDYEIRWFTPTVEVELCGHATLASAFVILDQLEPGQQSVRFHSRRAGVLGVEKRGDLLELDFPRRTFEKISPVSGLAEALDVSIEDVYLTSSGTFLTVVSDEASVRDCRPDFVAIKRLGRCVSLTARGHEFDFVSRYFAPTHGVDEDPVTGSSFCYLAPFWAERLGRDSLHALQVSRRGGEVHARLVGDRVRIAGKAVLFLEGIIRVQVEVN